MIEYLYDAIRATAGSHIELAARITDEEGAQIPSGIHFMLFDKNPSQLLFTVDGTFNEDEEIWEFFIDSELTANMCGRYWYCICVDGNPLCFKQPFYLCK